MNEKLPNSGPLWDKKLKKGWGEGKQPERRFLEFIEKYKSEIGPNILDIGSGEGRQLMPLTNAGYNVTGFDYSKEGLEKTKKKQAKEKTDANLVRGNFHDLPFKDNVYDTVISIQAMQHNNWQGAEAAFSEAARVLKPGGLFFLRVNSEKNARQGNETIIKDKGVTWSRDEDGSPGIHHSFSFKELKELADKYNLDIEPGAIDEKRAGDNFIILGQWNIVFRKKLNKN